MLSTGYLALWAAGESVVSQREMTARTVSGRSRRCRRRRAGARARAGGAREPGTRLVTVLRGLEGQGEIARIEVLALDRSVIVARPNRVDPYPDPRRGAALGGVIGGVGPILHYHRRPGDAMTELNAYAPVLANGRVVASGAGRPRRARPPSICSARHSIADAWVGLLVVVGGGDGEGLVVAGEGDAPAVARPPRERTDACLPAGGDVPDANAVVLTRR